MAVCFSLACSAADLLPWSNGTGYRSAQVQPGTSRKEGFTLMAAGVTRVTFTNQLRGDLALTNVVAHNGSGVAVGDVDQDGWPDLYFCGLQGPNRFYRNLGHWRFEERDAGEAACAGQLSTGAALADVEGDGDLDLLVNGTAAGTRLFLNDGKGRWTESKTSGLSRHASATSLALADIDLDGDLDLYCAHYIDGVYLADPTIRFAMARRGGGWEVIKVNGESSRLPRWKNRFEALEGGRVRELPEADGLYRNEGSGRFAAIQEVRGVFSNEQGVPVPPYRDWGLAAMFRDLNGDGAPDLYVCNDNASPDRVWINSGRGTFRLIDPIQFRHTSRSSMGIDMADINRDGHDDLFVLDMLARQHGKRMTQLMRDLPDPQVRERIEEQPRFNRNMLFLGRPDGSYAETALMAGVAATDWSFCPIFVDVDLDGYEDLLISNGFGFDVMDQDSHDQFRRRQRQMTPEQLKRMRQLHPAWPTPNAAFRNQGDGTFLPMSREWGFDHAGISYGMALGDLDNDGDLDVVVNHLNEAAGLYRNDSTAGRIAVRLKGLPPNTQGIGARLRLLGGAVPQSQEMICGGRYMSGDQAMRAFAAQSSSTKPLRLEVKWPNGDFSQIEAQANRIYEVDQAGATRPGRGSAAAPPSGPGKQGDPGVEAPRQNAAGLSLRNAPLSPEAVINSQSSLSQSGVFRAGGPYFTNASSWLGHAHSEDSFDDWSMQRLLPRRLSRLGPGLGWYDLNGDGWEDLMIAAGRGGKLAIFLNNQGQNFQRVDGVQSTWGDQGAVLGWSDGGGNRQILTAVSNYGETRESEIQAYALEGVGAPKRWPAGIACVGALASADIDGDGDLDLFVGGRFHSGRYPEPVSSALWINEKGSLQPSPSLSQPFASLGLVSGAAFSDLDADGDPDLALAIEWGPVRIFQNDRGRFVDVTTLWGLSGRTGWWTSVTSGDFDGDGRLDVAVGNWGRNSIYELNQPGPWRIFYGDWNEVGTLDLIEAWWNAGAWCPVRNRLWQASGLPDLPSRFPTHQAYGKATVADLLGARYQETRFVAATCLESGVWLNHGSRFEWRPLPAAAQQTPVFSMNTGDFDGDGREDLFLAQNFFGTESDLSRDDSGRGLWLRGDGNGSFAPVDGTITGIVIHGEQRGAALADFNQDGRVDLAVSQNNAATYLYINQRAHRGLRVVLRGPGGNPEAVGAQMRLLYASGRKGPCRLVQAGSGYGSQDAASQVLGLAETPAALWIRWPGGKEQIVSLQLDTWNLHIPYQE